MGFNYVSQFSEVVRIWNELPRRKKYLIQALFWEEGTLILSLTLNTDMKRILCQKIVVPMRGQCGKNVQQVCSNTKDLICVLDTCVFNTYWQILLVHSHS